MKPSIQSRLEQLSDHSKLAHHRRHLDRQHAVLGEGVEVGAELCEQLDQLLFEGAVDVDRVVGGHRDAVGEDRTQRKRLKG